MEKLIKAIEMCNIYSIRDWINGKIWKNINDMLNNIKWLELFEKIPYNVHKSHLATPYQVAKLLLTHPDVSDRLISYNPSSYDTIDDTMFLLGSLSRIPNGTKLAMQLHKKNGIDTINDIIYMMAFKCVLQYSTLEDYNRLYRMYYSDRDCNDKNRIPYEYIAYNRRDQFFEYICDKSTTKLLTGSNHNFKFNEFKVRALVKNYNKYSNLITLFNDVNIDVKHFKHIGEFSRMQGLIAFLIYKNLSKCSIIAAYKFLVKDDIVNYILNISNNNDFTCFEHMIKEIIPIINYMVINNEIIHERIKSLLELSDYNTFNLTNKKEFATRIYSIIKYINIKKNYTYDYKLAKSLCIEKSYIDIAHALIYEITILIFNNYKKTTISNKLMVHNIINVHMMCINSDYNRNYYAQNINMHYRNALIYISKIYGFYNNKMIQIFERMNYIYNSMNNIKHKEQYEYVMIELYTIPPNKLIPAGGVQYSTCLDKYSHIFSNS